MKNYRRFLPAALALTLLCSGAALAAPGDKTAPLVTLSYLEQTALPALPGGIPAPPPVTPLSL